MSCNTCCLPGKSSHQFYGSGYGENAFIAQYYLRISSNTCEGITEVRPMAAQAQASLQTKRSGWSRVFLLITGIACFGLLGYLLFQIVDQFVVPPTGSPAHINPGYPAAQWPAYPCPGKIAGSRRCPGDLAVSGRSGRFRCLRLSGA